MFLRITELHDFNKRTLARVTNGFSFMPFRKLKLKTLTLHRSFLKTFFWGQLVYYVHTLLHCRNFKWKQFVFSTYLKWFDIRINGKTTRSKNANKFKEILCTIKVQGHMLFRYLIQKIKNQIWEPRETDTKMTSVFEDLGLFSCL